MNLQWTFWKLFLADAVHKVKWTNIQDVFRMYYFNCYKVKDNYDRAWLTNG